MSPKAPKETKQYPRIIHLFPAKNEVYPTAMDARIALKKGKIFKSKEEGKVQYYQIKDLKNTDIIHIHYANKKNNNLRFHGFDLKNKRSLLCSVKIKK